MHERGLAHGDIYAHNILTNDVGHSLLGDFGAASFYDRTKDKTRERLDIRAFGYLIEDLLKHAEQGSDSAVIAKLQNLQRLCLNENITERPVFAEVCDIMRVIYS
ncbi:MAG: hypothetical protein A3D90_03760 [Sulfuricurvum sp. RIFCSPHIGHO2_02_FULL_43_9]|nr:MAG: hypothetical protein A3D90_03760 [Sulfuricurvum sp. RIFCSPHIGHO2_02_FULL_43_9]